MASNTNELSSQSMELIFNVHHGLLAGGVSVVVLDPPSDVAMLPIEKVNSWHAMMTEVSQEVETALNGVSILAARETCVEDYLRQLELRLQHPHSGDGLNSRFTCSAIRQTMNEDDVSFLGSTIVVDQIALADESTYSIGLLCERSEQDGGSVVSHLRVHAPSSQAVGDHQTLQEIIADLERTAESVEATEDSVDEWTILDRKEQALGDKVAEYKTAGLNIHLLDSHASEVLWEVCKRGSAVASDVKTSVGTYRAPEYWATKRDYQNTVADQTVSDDHTGGSDPSRMSRRQRARERFGGMLGLRRSA